MERKDEYEITQELAFKHAKARIVKAMMTKTPGIEKWEKAIIEKKPLKIFDINGKSLFYEFSIMKEKKMIGRIKVSANKILGPAVYSLEIGPRLWDPDKAEKKAIVIVQTKFKGAKILSSQLVCYSYPKIGILIVFENPEIKRKNWLIIDVASHKIIPVESTIKGLEGTGIWSIYESIPHKDRNDRVSRWEDDDLFRRILEGEVEKSGSDFMDATIGELATVQLFLRFESKTIPLTLYGQEHCVWCACATGQMLLRYHNYYYEQPDIVTAMGTIWNNINCNGGTGINGQVNGYETLSRNYLDAEVDNFPTWNKAKDEIDAERPFKSGIIWVPQGGGHARACAGYHRVRNSFDVYRLEDIWGRKIIYDLSLYIYDPWPQDPNNAFCNPRGGTEGWEPWDAAHFNHSNFIYLRPCTGTMICQD